MKVVMAFSGKVCKQRPQVNISGCLSVHGWRPAGRKWVVSVRWGQDGGWGLQAREGKPEGQKEARTQRRKYGRGWGAVSGGGGPTREKGESGGAPGRGRSP